MGTGRFLPRTLDCSPTLRCFIIATKNLLFLNPHLYAGQDGGRFRNTRIRNTTKITARSIPQTRTYCYGRCETSAHITNMDMEFILTLAASTMLAVASARSLAAARSFFCISESGWLSAWHLIALTNCEVAWKRKRHDNYSLIKLGCIHSTAELCLGSTY